MAEAADRRAAMKAALAAGAAKPAAAAPAPVAAPPVAAQVTAPPAEAPAEVPPAIPAPAPATGDTAEPPGMTQIRKAEQHSRRQLAAERAAMQADFETRTAAWQAKLAKADRHEQLTSNARRDPLAAIQALGFTDADYDGLGRLIYSLSPEGKKDPRWQQAGLQAQQALAQREHVTELQKVQTELQQIKESAAQREQAAAAAANLDAYAGNMTKAIGDDSPLAKARLAGNPAAARQALLLVAEQLYVNSGPSDDLRDVPTPAEVIRAYETQRAAELEGMRAEFEALARPRVAPTPVVAPVIAPAAPAALETDIAPRKLTREELLDNIRKLKQARG